jgi:hypothetical protein
MSTAAATALKHRCLAQPVEVARIAWPIDAHIETPRVHASLWADRANVALIAPPQNSSAVPIGHNRDASD